MSRTRAITSPDFRARLREEFARRRRVNRRYSVRAFGEFLGVDHSTLSQVLRGVRAVPQGCLRKWAERLRLGEEQIELYVAADGVDDLESMARRVRHLQWVSEATALMTNAAHWRLLQLLREPDWRPDMRWAAGRLGLHVDQLNEALSRLLRLGMLTIAGNQWCDRSGLATPDAAKVVDLGLARLRGAMSAS